MESDFPIKSHIINSSKNEIKPCYDDDFKEDSDDGSPFSVNDDDDDDVVGDFIDDDDDENENVAEVEFGHVRNLLPPSAKKPRLNEPVHSESSPAGSHNYQALKLRARTT